MAGAAYSVVPANMKTVVDDSICETLARGGWFYVQHRFDIDALAFALDAQPRTYSYRFRWA